MRKDVDAAIVIDHIGTAGFGIDRASWLCGKYGHHFFKFFRSGGQIYEFGFHIDIGSQYHISGGQISVDDGDTVEMC